MKVKMSYGEFEVERLAAHVRDLARDIPPANVWDRLAVEWTDINKDSVVVEIGAYWGVWSFRMAERYDPKLYIFEPQLWCCDVLRELLKDYQAKIYPYALGIKSGDFPVFEHETDGCTFETSEDRGWGKSTLRMEEIGKVFKKEKLTNIDLLHMNAEGTEFDLIPYLFAKKIFPKILMFQGHDQSREPELRELIKKYYTILWDWGTNLSAWKFNG